MLGLLQFILSLFSIKDISILLLGKDIIIGELGSGNDIPLDFLLIYFAVYT